MAGQASTLPYALHPDLVVVVEFGGTMVSRIDGKVHSSRRLRECRCPRQIYRGLH